MADSLRYFKRIIGLVGKKAGLKMTLMLILVIIQAVIVAFSPMLLADAINVVADGVMNSQDSLIVIDFEKLIYYILILVTLYITNYACKMVQENVLCTFSADIVYNVRIRIAEKIRKLPVGYFEKRKIGDIQSTVSNDVDVLSWGLQAIISSSMYSIILIVMVLAAMLSINIYMAAVVLISLPISFFSMKGIVKRNGKAYYAQQVLVGEIDGQIEEVLSGFSVIKAYSREEDVKNEFSERNKKLSKEYSRAQFMSSIIEPITQFIGNLGYIAVIIVGAFLAIKGRLSIGDIQAFINYVNKFNQPVQTAAGLSAQIQMIAAAGKRIFEFLDEEEETEIEESGNKNQSWDTVSFKNIEFGYNSDNIIIKDFSLDVSSGQQIAIVGPTGAGKSTLVKLLMRFYDVNSGSVSIDGINLTEMNRHSLRSGIGMVLQETWLFKGSIADNIRFGKIDASNEEVIEAARKAEADYFIKTLPGGYDFELSEDGSNISAGQRQLITIARAILANRPILILDEATSSVDTQTEHRIQRAMTALMKGKTSFVIAHRLSTIRNADVILVLKDGDIVEQGNHSALLERKGFYYDLYNAQFE